MRSNGDGGALYASERVAEELGVTIVTVHRDPDCPYLSESDVIETDEDDLADRGLEPSACDRCGV